MSRQLALTRPTKRVDLAGLTFKQRSLVRWIRWYHGANGVPFRPADIGRADNAPRYSDYGAACRRLARRGLLRRTKRGYYRPAVVGERKR